MLHISQKDIDFLSPPVGSESLQLSSENIKRGYQNSSQRSIFYNTDLDSYEVQKIEEFKRELSSANILHTLSDRELLKFIYSANFDTQRARYNLQNSINWRQEVQKVPLTHKVLDILHSGLFYHVGRDSQQRPTLVINLDKFDSIKHDKEELSLVLAFYIDTIKQYCFLQGKIERFNIILDVANKDINRFDPRTIEHFINNFTNAFPQVVEKIYVLNASDSARTFWQDLRNEEISSRVEFVNKENLKEKFPSFQLERRHGGLLANITIFWPPSAIALQLPSTATHKQTVISSYTTNTTSSPAKGDNDGFVERTTVAGDYIYRSPEKREQKVSSSAANTYERKTITTMPSNMSPENIFTTEEYNKLQKKKTLSEAEKKERPVTKSYDFENQDLLYLIIGEYENLKTDKFLLERPEGDDIVRLSTRLSVAQQKNNLDASGERVKRSAPRDYHNVSGHNVEEWSSGRYLKNTTREAEHEDEEDHKIGVCGFCLTRKAK